MKAWHFVGDKLRDERDVPADGVKLVHDGAVVLCKSGLHASLDAFDALDYAPGNILCEVECNGEIVCGLDKLVCSERTIIRRVDFTEALQEFARSEALKVVHLWDADEITLQYLRTGDETLREHARVVAEQFAQEAWFTVDTVRAAWAAEAARIAALATSRNTWDAWITLATWIAIVAVKVARSVGDDNIAAYKASIAQSRIDFNNLVKKHFP